LRGDFFKDTDGDIKREDVFPYYWQCKDGRFQIQINLTFSQRARVATLVQWMIDEGMDVGELGEINWEEVDPSILTPERRQNWRRIISGFFAKLTRQEAFEQAAARGLSTMGPVLNMSEVLKHEQPEARGFWDEIEHPELGRKVLYPGHLFLSSETENQNLGRAPHVGEHNEQVYGQEMGLSAQEIASLKEAEII
jgi:crotonobetainyl-CoA:carnitine CoA-transferase CaiB-like acyl-CoA transferase